MGKVGNERKKRLNRQRHEFLLTFFDSQSGYDKKQVNGWWLVKQWNGNNNQWEVAIYTPDGMKKKQEYTNQLANPML